MTRSAWMLLLIPTLGLAQPATRPAGAPTSAPAPAASPSANVPTTGPVDLGCYAAMRDDCRLNVAQQLAVTRKAAALKELEAEEAAQCQEVTEKLANAYKDKDRQQVDRMRKELARVRSAVAQVSEQLRTDILAVLTPDQRLAWETAQLERQCAARYRQLKFDLTADQAGKLREACRLQGQALAGKPCPPSPAQAREAMDRVDAEILTRDQRRRALD